MVNSHFAEKIESIKMSYRILIFVGSVALVIALFLFQVYFPKTEKISMIRKEIAGLEKRIDQARKKAENLAEFEAEEAEVDAQFKEALKLLPDKKEIPSLLKRIDALGNESDLKFCLFKPEKEIPRGFYFEIPVSIEVSGRYHDVVCFFDKVSNMKRIVNIFDVSIKPEKPLSTTLKTTFRAVTYRFRSKADVEKAQQKRKRKRK